MSIHIRTVLSSGPRRFGQREFLLCLSKVGHRTFSPLSRFGQRAYKVYVSIHACHALLDKGFRALPLVRSLRDL